MTAEITLTKIITTIKENGDTVENMSSKQVFADIKSIGSSEFYQAQNTRFRPEVKAVVWADEYSDETELTLDDDEYTIIRTYRDGDKIELTGQRKGGNYGDT